MIAPGCPAALQPLQINSFCMWATNSSHLSWWPPAILLGKEIDDLHCRDLVQCQGSQQLPCYAFLWLLEQDREEISVWSSAPTWPLIRFSYSLWTSFPWAHEGSMWICSLILVELQAQHCRGNSCVFFHWLHWSMLAAAGTAVKREHGMIFGKRHCSKWQKLLKKLLLNAWTTSLRPQMLEVQTQAPTGSSELHSHAAFRSGLCLPHCVVLKHRSPSFAFQSVWFRDTQIPSTAEALGSTAVFVVQYI